MLIRSARTEDAAAVAAFTVMAEAEVLEAFFGASDEKTAAQALERFILSPVPNRYSLGHCLVAEENDRPAGSIFAFPADSQRELDVVLVDFLNRQRGLNLDELFFEGAPGTFYLSTMGVDPAMRGQGVGSHLMAAALEKGKSIGYKQASLLVSVDKERVRKLYERIGFSVLEDIEMIGVRYHRMVCDL